MNLYLLTNVTHYEPSVYDACIVCAKDEESARLIRPDGRADWENIHKDYDGWVNTPNQLECQYLGKADDSIEPGVVLASFVE